MAGWVLGQAGLKTKSRKGVAALILAANMPDIDVFFGWVPWAPLSTHRGFTHGLLGGVLVMPPILCGLLLLLDRWQVARGTEFKSGLPIRPWWLLALCFFGALTHPYLDLLTTYSVQLFSIASSDWWHADGLFIIDVWLWFLLGGGIFLSDRRERNGGDWRRPPRVAIAIALAYIGLNLALSARADADVLAASRDATRIFASPPAVLFWRRDLVWKDGDCYRRSSYDPLRGMSAPGPCEPTNMSDPIVQTAIRHSPRLQKFLIWSVMPQASVTRTGCTAQVAIGDARYGSFGGSRLARHVTVRTC